MHSHRRLLIPRRSLGSSLARWMATSTLSVFKSPLCSSAQPRETLYSLLRSTTASPPSTPILLLASNFGRPASLGPGSPRCPGSIPVLLLPPTTYSQRSASRRRLSLTRRRTPYMSRRRRRKRWAQGAATARPPTFIACRPSISRPAQKSLGDPLSSRLQTLSRCAISTGPPCCCPTARFTLALDRMATFATGRAGSSATTRQRLPRSSYSQPRTPQSAAMVPPFGL